METEVFYWTGVILWWALCISGGCSVIAASIIAPIVAYRQSKKYLWQWKYGAILAQTGFTDADVEFAVSYSRLPKDISLPELLKWVRNVKERGDALKSNHGQGGE